MAKKKRQASPKFANNRGVEAVKNQLNESYQSGVIDNQLENNRGIHHFNNRKN
jgi:hypothetical protein